MIDLISATVFSDSDKQLYGPIIAALFGAIAGAFLGAATTYFLANRERRLQIDNQDFIRRRTTFLENNTALEESLYTLDKLIIGVVKNMSIFTDYNSGIYVENGAKGKINKFQLNSPVGYHANESTGLKIYNQSIQIHWMNLMNEIILQNTIIDEFNQYYLALRSEVHTMLLNGKKPNESVIKSDNNSISNNVKDALKASELLRIKCIRVLAMIEVFRDYYALVNTREFNKSAQFTNHLDKMMEYEITDDMISDKVNAYTVKYNATNMFKSTELH